MFKACSAEHERTKVAKRSKPKGSYIYIFVCPESIEESGRFRKLIFGIHGTFVLLQQVEVSG